MRPEIDHRDIVSSVNRSEQGRLPVSRAVIAADQSMLAIVVMPSVMLVPISMKRPVKSLRARNDPWLMRSSALASAG